MTINVRYEFIQFILAMLTHTNSSRSIEIIADFSLKQAFHVRVKHEIIIFAASRKSLKCGIMKKKFQGGFPSLGSVLSEEEMKSIKLSSGVYATCDCSLSMDDGSTHYKQTVTEGEYSCDRFCSDMCDGYHVNPICMRYSAEWHGNGSGSSTPGGSGSDNTPLCLCVVACKLGGNCSHHEKPYGCSDCICQNQCEYYRVVIKPGKK